MKTWIEDLKSNPKKKAMPILSFPCIQLLGVTVKELISNSDLQANGMKAVADACDSCASVSMMDLSVEAEAFGSKVKFSEDEVPTVIGRILESPEDAQQLKVPDPKSGRCGLYIGAIGKAKKLIEDRPVFAGAIGPFSLAGRLMDMTEIMVNCYVDPEMVHTTLKKAAEFITGYILGFRDSGADGVVIAEPAAGLLSPELNREFSVPYIQKIINQVQREDFIVIYHNCGNTIPLISDLLTSGASAYHFGNAIDMEEMLTLIPDDIVVMGNINPAGQFRNGTPESIKNNTKELLVKCSRHTNFVISSGCDIPPLSSWDNIQAFFQAVTEYNSLS